VSSLIDIESTLVTCQATERNKMSVMNSDSQQAQSEVVAIAQELIGRLARAWNSGDGDAFGAPFATDAEFVAIRGDLHSGRAAIGAGHQEILDTIYAGSRLDYEVLQARPLDDRVILVHVRGTLDAPSGPLAGRHSSTATVVLVRRDRDYEIAAFHNTLVAE
jgi:uncharacterized protein (TIGR02246 family)